MRHQRFLDGSFPAFLAIVGTMIAYFAAGTVAIWGEALTNPTDIIARVDSLPLALIAAIMFFAATVGINLVVNFIQQLFSASEDEEYFYDNGWNKKALAAFILPAIFSIATVWMPTLGFLSGFCWVIGAALGGLVYFVITKK